MCIVAAIVAMDENRVIGFNNGIPWKIPGEQKYFAEKTKGHTVLMGRKTFESLPERYRPLPERLNVVVSRRPGEFPEHRDTICVGDPLHYIQACKSGENAIRGEIVWVIGGEQIYSQTADLWDELYLTLVFGTHQGDAYFPEVLSDFTLIAEERFSTHSYQRFRRESKSEADT